jgi:hypothetical protein
MELRGLTPAHGEPGTETAQRFLASAYDSVEAVLQTLKTVRELRRQETGRRLRRLTSPEEDLLRAAIVFTAAGLDATLKQLIRDTLPALLETSRQAHDKFESFAADKLGTAEVADTKMMARYLTSPDPRSRLIEDYVYDLTDRACSRPKKSTRRRALLVLTMQDCGSESPTCESSSSPAMRFRTSWTSSARNSRATAHAARELSTTRKRSAKKGSRSAS